MIRAKNTFKSYSKIQTILSIIVYSKIKSHFSTSNQALFTNLHAKTVTLGLRQHQLARLKFVTATRKARWAKVKRLFLKVILATFIFTVFLEVSCLLDWPLSKKQLADATWRLRGWSARESQTQRCLVRASPTAQNLARPPIDCSFCEGVSGVLEVANLSQLDFSHSFAYSGQPVVVSDGCLGWSAVEVFSFNFFKGNDCGKEEDLKILA